MKQPPPEEVGLGSSGIVSCEALRKEAAYQKAPLSLLRHVFSVKCDCFQYI